MAQRWPNNRSPTFSGAAAGRHQAGFTYLGVLMLVAIMGALLATTGEVWSTLQRRDKEQELLFVGSQFRAAIRQYYERSPGGAKRYPRKLESLLQDDRYPTVQRYLRKIYVDPITGKPEWGLIKAPDDGIAGVYSLSRLAPVKVDGFDAQDAGFKGATSYSEWQFGYQLVRPTLTDGQDDAGDTP